MDLRTLLENEPVEWKKFMTSIEKGHAEYDGTELSNILPSRSRRRGSQRQEQKQSAWQKIQQLVQVFLGI